jgi:predicted RNase H-like HicB family nuclease
MSTFGFCLKSNNVFVSGLPHNRSTAFIDRVCTEFMQHSTSKKTYTVIIEQDEDGLYVAKVPDIVGCHTQGKTVSEVMNRIKEAIQACNKDEARRQ